MSEGHTHQWQVHGTTWRNRELIRGTLLCPDDGNLRYFAVLPTFEAAVGVSDAHWPPADRPVVFSEPQAVQP